MGSNTAYLKFVALLFIGLSIKLGANAEAPAPAGITSSSDTHLDVYKSPTCGCCADWMEHVEESGYTLDAHHPEDLTGFKLAQGIGLRYQSCHTAISAEGYRFEGHVPAKYVTQYLSSPPRGLLVWRYPVCPSAALVWKWVIGSCRIKCCFCRKMAATRSMPT